MIELTGCIGLIKIQSFFNLGWIYKSKVGVGSIPGHFVFCRLGWADPKLCWVSPPSVDQPACYRCVCEMRNPTTADWGTESQNILR